MRRLFALSFVALSLNLKAADNKVVFAEKLAPILKAHCSSCHSGVNPQSDFSAATYDELLKGGKHGAALVPGSSESSLLIQYVRGAKTPRMPLGGTLSPDIISQLAAAIDAMNPQPAPTKPVDGHLTWLLKTPKTSPVP